MKRIFAIAAIASLAACSGNDADTAGEETAATEEVEADDVTAAAPPVGSYVITNEDATTATLTTNAVGVYTATSTAGDVKGTFTAEGNKTCFDPAGDEGATCWTNTAPDEAGVYTATSDAGATVTFKAAE